MEVSKGCATLLTSEPEALLTFYRDTLGLQVRLEGPRFSELSSAGGFRVAIMRQDAASAPPTGAALGFAVADWAGARETLRRSGLLDREEEDPTSGVRLL